MKTRYRALIPTVLAGLLASWLVYRPERKLPFESIDFAEFLPLLRLANSAIGQLHDVVVYYAGKGRATVLPLAALVIKWNLFGQNTVGWHLVRAAVMWAVIVLTFMLLRRLGVNKLGAVIGASVFLFAPPASLGWTHLTTSEPLGTVFLLLLCLVVLTNRPWWTERRIAVIVGVLVILLAYTKEMLLATLFLPVLLVAVRAVSTGTLGRSTRFRTVLAATSVSAVGALIPVALVMRSAGTDSYAASFGTHIRPFDDAIAAWVRGLTPFDPFGALPVSVQGLLDVLFIGILVTGWRLRRRSGSVKLREDRLLLWGLLLFPLLGGLIYLPWPYFATFYAIPYLLSLAILVGFAITALQSKPQLQRLAAGVWLWCLVAGAVSASNDANMTAAGQKLQFRAVSAIRANDRVDTVYVATPEPPHFEWAGLGATLARYGMALGEPVPALRDVTCATALGLFDRGLPPKSMVLTYNAHHFVDGALSCGQSRTPDSVIVERYTRLRWSRFPIGRDSFYISLFGPDL